MGNHCVGDLSAKKYIISFRIFSLFFHFYKRLVPKLLSDLKTQADKLWKRKQGKKCLLFFFRLLVKFTLKLIKKTGVMVYKKLSVFMFFFFNFQNSGKLQKNVSVLN